MIEIEAKFRVDQPAIFADLLRLTTLGPFALTPTPGIEYQHNTYFDTLDRRLTARRYSLRVRDLGRRRIGAVKRSLHTYAGIHTREEWEVACRHERRPVCVASQRGARSGDCGARRRSSCPAAHRTYTTPIYVRNSRFCGGSQASLDEVMIAAGDRTINFREIEVELLEGQARADLDALIGHLRSRYMLVPESRGKKARGLALLDNPTQAGTMLPISLERGRAIGARG